MATVCTVGNGQTESVASTMRCSIEKAVLTNFTKFTVKQL